LSSKIIANTPWYFFFISLGLSAGIALWLYYKNKKNTEAPERVLVGMGILRFLSFFFVLLFLLNIFFKRLQNTTENPSVLVAIDNSSSIVATGDSTFIKGAFQPALDKLSERLAEKYAVKTLLFGSKAETTDKKPAYSEKETDIENLINEVENNYSNQNIGALVIISDGIYNKGANPVYPAEKLGYPVYTVAMGDTNEIRDVLIQKVNHNQVAYSGNNFPVEVILNARKFSGKEVTVSLLENGIEKARQNIKINSDNFLSTSTFTLAAAGVGVVRYSAKVTVLEGEKNTANNTQPFVIEIIDNKERILLLANTPHPDIAAIKDAIIDGTNYEIEYSLAQDFSKPLKQYSLVILHGFSPAQMVLLNECKKDLVPFWIINPSAPENLPGIKISGSLNKFNDAEPYVDNSFGLFTISDDLKKFAKDLPAVKTFFGNYSLGNGSNSLINQRIGVVETENPILFFTEISGLKSGIFLGDGLWKWKFRDFAEHKNHNLFTELISKSVQYLSVKSDKSFFRLSAPKVINENTDVELGAEVYNKSYEAITEPDVTLVLTNSDNKKFNYTFSKTNSAYKLNVGTLPPGEYRYEASVKVRNELFVKQGLFAVKEVVSEKINTVANHQLLFQLSHHTNGKLYYPADLQILGEDLLKSEKIRPVTYTQITTSSLIDLKWLFWIVLVLLAVEWFFRKRFLSI